MKKPVKPKAVSKVKRSSPTSIARSSKCMHYWFLECHGDPDLKTEPDDGLQFLFDRGLAHESAMIETLSEYHEPVWDGKDWSVGYKSTVKLMRDGVPWIYQGVLRSDRLAGLPDLLQRMDSPSNLGDHSYRPVDIKGHKAITDKDCIQLQAYASLLEPILGYRVGQGAIWLNTGEIKSVDLNNGYDEFLEIMDEMASVYQRATATTSIRCSECGICHWRTFCKDEWGISKSISLLPGVAGKTAMKFHNAGFESWEDLAESTSEEVAERLGINPTTARKHWLHAVARNTKQPQSIRPCSFPKNVPVHFYDIETYGGITYLHGNIRIFKNEREEKQFLAKHPSEEENAWHQYLDYLAVDDEAIIYCWSTYEYGFVNSLWNKYGGNEDGYRLLRDNLIDQCKFTKDHFALPTSSYNIKEVAPVFGFHWDAEDAGGLNSESWYREWLATNDENILRKILRYNLDDVVAMEVIDRSLKTIKKIT